MNDIIKFFYGAAQAFEGEPRHVENFELENATSKNEFDWSLVINKSLMAMKIGPLVNLTLKTARLAGVRITGVPALMQHLPNIYFLSIISFWLPIAIVDVSHMTIVLMTVEELTLEAVNGYRNKIVEQEKIDMHAFVGRYARNIVESIRPFEDSRRGREDYDGMLPCFSPDHGIYFQIQRHGIVFTKLRK
ncbi:hypothetical protein B9Z55_023485 [Caenorhabditis nigoni]|uniref:Uncharacterized protein n=1 Tax=Caenorhabditis nigoni TaxID=1611254 RepID=A0A2G5SQA1_9PELO|nr:hypothetical protein B9Z55_023485 [Caenorhabditis nigoni]